MAMEEATDRSRPLALHLQVESLIRKEIDHEGLRPGARLPTEAELCKRFGVSRSTIRQALNRLEMQGLITRARGKGTFVRRVEPAVSEGLAPAPNKTESAAPLKHKVLGLVFCARSDTLQMNILLGVERAARSRGYAIMFGYSGEDANTEAQEIERLLRIGADGMIVMPVSNVAMTAGVRAISANKTPLVLVDRHLSELETSYVVSDGFEGMYRATEHLIILGYDAFAFVTSGRELLGTTSVMDRYRGFCKALEDYCMGQFIKPPVPVNLMDKEEVRQLLARRSARQLHPTALVAVHDAVAINLMKTASTIGLLPPTDFAIVGFDDLPLSSHLTVPLTTVAQPRFDMGFKSGHLLIDQIEGRVTTDERIVLPVSLVVRESCGAHHIVCARVRAA